MKITFDKRNYRKHSEQNKKRIRKSLTECGAGRSVLVDKDGCLIAGNGVYEQAEKMGIKTRVVETDGTELVVVKRTDIGTDDPKRKTLALADNATSDNVEWDLPNIAADFDVSVAEDWGIDFGGGLSVDQEPQEAKEDDFDEDKDHVATICQEGDVWQLGEHRLMCGDSTKAEDVERLMNGEKADMCFTDPPFGNDLGYGRGQLGERRIANDEDTDILYDAFGTIDEALKNNTHCLVWIQWRTFSELEKAFNKYKLRTVVIWDKMQAGLAGGGFAEQYEMCCVFIKGRATQNHYSGNIWQVPRIHAKRENMPHPHQKPIEVLSKGFDMCSKQGDIILDLFGGSGSTLIAAEQLGRKCYMMEIDPHYCDVIIARWEKLTGQKAVKL